MTEVERTLVPITDFPRKSEENKYFIGNNLNLCNCGLYAFPENILSMNNLTKICLAKNMIADIPAHVFEALHNVKWLDLRSNMLTNIPKEIVNLKELSVLLLENNHIHCLPNELGLLKKLRSLNVKNNPITYPPENVLNSGTNNILSFLSQNHLLQDENIPNNSNKMNPEGDDQDDSLTNLLGMKDLHISDQKDSGTTNDVKSVWKSRMYQRIRKQRNKMKNSRKVPALKSFIKQSARHEAFIPDNPEQPSLKKLNAMHRKQIRFRMKQHSNMMKLKAVQKIKDAGKMEMWKSTYQKEQQKLRMRQMKKSVSEIMNESNIRVLNAPFDVTKTELKMIDNREMQDFRHYGIEPEPRPPNLDPNVVLALELGNIERDRKLIDQVTKHLNHVVEHGMLPMPNEQHELKNELTVAKNNLDSAIRLHQFVTRRLETLQLFHGSNRRDLF